MGALRCHPASLICWLLAVLEEAVQARKGCAPSFCFIQGRNASSLSVIGSLVQEIGIQAGSWQDCGHTDVRPKKKQKVQKNETMKVQSMTGNLPQHPTSHHTEIEFGIKRQGKVGIQNKPKGCSCSICLELIVCINDSNCAAYYKSYVVMARKFGQLLKEFCCACMHLHFTIRFVAFSKISQQSSRILCLSIRRLQPFPWGKRGCHRLTWVPHHSASPLK